jgi:hypothetical protein
MTRVLWALAFVATVVATVSVVSDYRGRGRAKTPQEFVEKMRDAYRRKDADTILAMKLDPQFFKKAGVPEDLRKEIESYNRDKDREELQKELDREGMWYKGWLYIQYASHTEEKDHIHVSLAAGGGRTSIVLVRDADGYLKVHPWPSMVD